MPTIRLANVDDAVVIAQIHVWSWQQAYSGLLPQAFLDSLEPADRVDRWRAMLDEQGASANATLVLVDDGRVQGFAHVGPSRDDDAGDGVGEVVSMYLRPQVWRRGYGRLLMSEACDTLTDAGFVKATLWVLAGNARAIGFYESSGWTADGTTKLATIANMPVTEARYRRGL